MPSKISSTRSSRPSWSLSVRFKTKKPSSSTASPRGVADASASGSGVAVGGRFSPPVTNEQAIVGSTNAAISRK
jgi:hypothetical protein